MEQEEINNIEIYKLMIISKGWVYVLSYDKIITRSIQFGGRAGHYFDTDCHSNLVCGELESGKLICI